MNRADRYTCEQAFLRLDDYIDREISPAERQLVEAHLAVCEVCLKEFEFQAKLIETLRQKMRRIAVPEDLMARISRLLEEPEETAPPPSGA
jgi:anti-sigma factor (TIGR02949 family)